MVLYFFLFKIVKNYNFVTKSQLQEDREIVECCRKCIGFREKLTGDENEVLCQVLITLNTNTEREEKIRVIIPHNRSQLTDFNSQLRVTGPLL